MTHKKEIEPVEQLQKQVEQAEVKPKTRNLRGIVVRWYMVIVLALFFGLALLAKHFPYFPIDLKVTRTIQLIQLPFFREIMVAISAIGFPPTVFFVIGGISILLFLMGLRLESIMSGFSAVSMTLIGLELKDLVGRPRPTKDLVDVMALLNENSFPSGHVVMYVAYFGFLFYITYTFFKKTTLRYILMAIELFFIFGIGPSRIYLGAHWFSDVLGAFLVSSVWLLIIIFIYHWIKDKYFHET